MKRADLGRTVEHKFRLHLLCPSPPTRPILIALRLVVIINFVIPAPDHNLIVVLILLLLNRFLVLVLLLLVLVLVLALSLVCRRCC